MRYTILVLAVALAAESTQARADMVTYNMTGTIQYMFNPYPSVNMGDHVTWTLQYDRSIPLLAPYTNEYQTNGAVITNVVDQTTGYHFPAFFLSPSSTFSLGNFGIRVDSNDPSSFTYNSLSLVSNNSLPTLNLANLQLNDIPLRSSPDFDPFASNFNYVVASGVNPGISSPGIGFYASVDSISAPMRGAPEPGSLTLFLLGAAGLAARGMRRRLGQIG